MKARSESIPRTTKTLSYQIPTANTRFERFILSSEIKKKLKLPTLSYRRLRGDLIETYKILHDVYDPQTVKFLNTRKESADRSSISGNTLTLFSQHSNLDLRLSSFSIRIVKSWNKLPESVVSAPSVNSFKNRLDKFYENHELVYDRYKPEPKIK